MKKVLLGSFLLLCILLFTVPTFAMKNEPDNFRGIPWGAPLPKNNLFGKNKWGLRHHLGSIYMRDEEVSIGGAKTISPIEYEFYDDWGFTYATVFFSEQKNYDLIRKAIIDNWGEPDIEKRYPHTDPETNKPSVLVYSYWLGERIDVILSYKLESNDSGMLMLGMKNYSEILDKERAKYKQKQSGF